MSDQNSREFSLFRGSVFTGFLAIAVVSSLPCFAGPAAPEVRVSVAGAPGAGGEILSLKQLVHQSLTENPSYLETLRQVDQVSFEDPLAKATLFPVIGWTTSALQKKDALNSGNLNLSQNPGTTGAYNQGNSYPYYTSSLTLTQPIFRWGVFSAVNVAKEDIQVSKINADITSRNLISQLVLAYYQIVLDHRNYESYIKQEKIVHESLETAQKRERTGRGQLLDVLQTKTQIAILKSQISTSANQLQIDAANLATLSGRPMMAKIQVPDQMEFPNIAMVDQFVANSKAKVLELDKNEVLIRQVDDNRSVTWGQNAATVNLTGAYNFNSYTSSNWFVGDTNSWQVGLVLNIPIFSGLSSHYQDQQLLAQKSFLETDRENIRNTVNQSQVTAYKQLQTAETTIEQGIEALSLAQASSNEAIRNYRLATIDYIQFLTVQQSLIQAEQSLAAYRYSYLQALTNYVSATGIEMLKLVDFLETR